MASLDNSTLVVFPNHRLYSHFMFKLTDYVRDTDLREPKQQFLRSSDKKLIIVCSPSVQSRTWTLQAIRISRPWGTQTIKIRYLFLYPTTVRNEHCVYITLYLKGPPSKHANKLFLSVRGIFSYSQLTDHVCQCIFMNNKPRCSDGENYETESGFLAFGPTQ